MAQRDRSTDLATTLGGGAMGVVGLDALVRGDEDLEEGEEGVRLLGRLAVEAQRRLVARLGEPDLVAHAGDPVLGDGGEAEHESEVAVAGGHGRRIELADGGDALEAGVEHVELLDDVGQVDCRRSVRNAFNCRARL